MTGLIILIGIIVFLIFISRGKKKTPSLNQSFKKALKTDNELSDKIALHEMKINLSTNVKSNQHFKNEDKPESPIVNQKIICANCNTLNDNYFKFCRVCGNNIDYTNVEEIQNEQSFDYIMCPTCFKLTQTIGKKCRYCVHCGEFYLEQKDINESKIIHETELRNNDLERIPKNINIEISEFNLIDNNKDNSIIDITPTSYRTEPYSNLKIYPLEVPYWSHQYVYSYSEINRASDEQKRFYAIFKDNFLKGEYLDLKGNTNYAFILLFNLLDSYDNYTNISELENHIKALGQNYPKTKSYGISFLIKKMESKGNYTNISRLRNENYIQYNNYEYDWKLGNKYKTKLNLNDDEVEQLNQINYPNNNFCNIEYCLIEVIKLYLATIKDLKTRYILEGTTLQKQFQLSAETIVKNQFRYRKGSSNFNYSIYSITHEYYSTIFKYCENTVREIYGHKRKLSTETYYIPVEAKVEFEEKIVSKVIESHYTLTSKIAPLNSDTEIELNSQNTTRWKIRFDELITNYQDNSTIFFEEIISLGNLNIKNPSIENIFFEASKFISKIDKEIALKLYVYYLHYDLKSATFDNKQLTKTIQKNLFKTNEQLHQFEVVVSEFIKDKNLDKALAGVSSIYTTKRKKIQIDTALIKEVQEQHSETVELLNEYLKDEYENDNNSVKTQEINDDEIEIEITQKNEAPNTSIYLSEIPFTPIHISILDTFVKNNYAVPQSELEVFAKSKGFFKNQLIENINEICYEILDDVLIEDEDDYNIINPQYYQRILAV